MNMKLVNFMALIELVKLLHFFIEAAPHTIFEDQLYRESKVHRGIPSEKNLQMTRFNRDSDAIVFQGPSNAQRTDTVIKFPSDDDEVDLSGSFTPSNPDKVTENSISKMNLTLGAFANCFIYSKNGTIATGSANTGIVQYSNGTQAIYSKCEVIHLIV